MRKETELAFLALRKRLEIMEMMTESMKWITSVAEENDQLRQELGDHDLTRIQLMNTEREREDLTLTVKSQRERIDLWRKATLDLAEILFDMEKKGAKFTKAQQRKITKVMKESQKND